VRKLIARDADVNKTGWAPLHYAASAALAADADIIAAAGEPCLHRCGIAQWHHAADDGRAVWQRRDGEVLLDEGADPTLKTSWV
jgi:hypothetical protein